MELIKNLRMVAVGVCVSNAIHCFLFGATLVGLINLAVVVFNLLPEIAILRKKVQESVQTPES